MKQEHLDSLAKILCGILLLMIVGAALLIATAPEQDNPNVQNTAEEQRSTAKSAVSETLVVNPCTVSSIALRSSPDGLGVGKIPGCANIVVEVLDRKCYNDVEFDLIRYGSQEGWATRRLLTCTTGCDAAPDTICKA